MRKPHRNCIEWSRERQSKTRSESIRGPIAQDAVDNWLFTDAQRTFVRAMPLKCPDEMRGPETSLTRADWLAGQTGFEPKHAVADLLKNSQINQYFAALAFQGSFQQLDQTYAAKISLDFCCEGRIGVVMGGRKPDAGG